MVKKAKMSNPLKKSYYRNQRYWQTKEQQGKHEFLTALGANSQSERVQSEILRRGGITPSTFREVMSDAVTGIDDHHQNEIVGKMARFNDAKHYLERRAAETGTADIKMFHNLKTPLIKQEKAEIKKILNDLDPNSLNAQLLSARVKDLEMVIEMDKKMFDTYISLQNVIQTYVKMYNEEKQKIFVKKDGQTFTSAFGVADDFTKNQKFVFSNLANPADLQKQPQPQI